MGFTIKSEVQVNFRFKHALGQEIPIHQGGLVI